MKKHNKQKPLYYYELQVEAVRHDLSDTEMAHIGAMAKSTYSLKKNGHYPWLLSECKAYCERFNRSIYGFFLPLNNSIE